MEKAKKGMWVEIENQVLSNEQRAPQIPEDTRNTPLMMWTRGFLVNETAKIGGEVTIKTLADRTTKGKLVTINPSYNHDFGNVVPELLETGVSVKNDVNEG